MQTEIVFLGHIVGWTGLACDPAKLSAVRNWHAPDKVKGVRQFVGFVGYYRRFVKDFADLAAPLVALTRKGVPFVWMDHNYFHNIESPIWIFVIYLDQFLRIGACCD